MKSHTKSTANIALVCALFLVQVAPLGCWFDKRSAADFTNSSKSLQTEQVSKRRFGRWTTTDEPAHQALSNHGRGLQQKAPPPSSLPSYGYVRTVGPICDVFDNLMISCPSGMVISNILSAFFGRVDNAICAFHHFNIIGCSYLGYAADLRSSCMGRIRCGIRPRENIDPCYMVYKYIIVSYACDFPTAPMPPPPPPQPSLTSLPNASKSSYELGPYYMGPYNIVSFPDPDAKWIWSRPDAYKSAPTDIIVTFTGYIYVEAEMIPMMRICVDDSATLIVNDEELLTFSSCTMINMNTLKYGVNTVQVRCQNTRGPAGLLFTIMLNDYRTAVLAHSNSSWSCQEEAATTAPPPSLPSSPPLNRSSCVLGSFNVTPWNIKHFPDQDAKWIWSRPDAQINVPTDIIVTFTRYIYVASDIIPVNMYSHVDNIAHISVNGGQMGITEDFDFTSTRTLLLTRGFNAVRLRCQNMGGPAGVLLTIMGADGVVLARSDSSWDFEEEVAPFAWPPPSLSNSLSQPPSQLPTYGVHPPPTYTVSNAVEFFPADGWPGWLGNNIGPGKGFQDTNASWIGASLSDRQDGPVDEMRIFTTHITAAANGMIALLHIIAFDNAAVFLNGIYIDTLTLGVDIDAYDGRPLRLTLAQGINTLSVHLVNIRGVTSLLASVLAADGQTVLTHTDSSWTYQVLSLPSPLACPDVDGYIARAGYDHRNEDDIPPWGGTSTVQVARLCNKTPSCEGFNSDGWLKTNVTPTASDAPGFCLYKKIKAPHPPLPPLPPLDGEPSFELGPFNVTPWNAPWVLSGSFPDENAKWIWSRSDANKGAPLHIIVTFTRYIYVATDMSVYMHAHVDDIAIISVNGAQVGVAFLPPTSKTTLFLKRGFNVISLRCQNTRDSAGVLLSIMGPDGDVLAQSDSSWRWQEDVISGDCSPHPGIRLWGGGYGFGLEADHVAPYPENQPTAKACAASCLAKAACLSYVYSTAQGTCFKHSTPYVGFNIDATANWVSGSCETLHASPRPPLDQSPPGHYSFELGASNMDPWYKAFQTQYFPDPKAKWIWSRPGAQKRAPTDKFVTFIGYVNVATDTFAVMLIHVDDVATRITLNGGEVMFQVLSDVSMVQATLWLRQGVNVVNLRCQNMGGPAGLLLTIMKNDADNRVVLARSDSSWSWQEEDGASVPLPPPGRRPPPLQLPLPPPDRRPPPLQLPLPPPDRRPPPLQYAVELGPPGMAPWGSWNIGPGKGFKDMSASWIWASRGAQNTASTTEMPIFSIQITVGPNNTVALLYLFVDDWASVIVNGVFMDTFRGGWDTSPDNDGGPLSITLLQGINTLSIRAVNMEGPAGLLASVLSADGQTVLSRTNSSWTYTMVSLPSPLACPPVGSYVVSVSADHAGDNITPQRVAGTVWSTAHQLARLCNLMPACKGFNTDGFLKHTVSPTASTLSSFCLYSKLESSVPGTPVSLALKPLVASSLASVDGGSTLKNVADGNISTIFHSGSPDTTLLSGSAYDYTPYVGIELSQLSYIWEIVIYNRPFFEYRLQNAELRVGLNEFISNSSNNGIGSNPLVWKQNTTQGSVIVVDLNPPVLGKWISLQNFNPDHKQTQLGYPFILNIMDIQVFGVPAQEPPPFLPSSPPLDMPSCKLGDFNMHPWNIESFPDQGAKWIWSRSDAQNDAPTDIIVTFTGYIYVATKMSVYMHLLVDNMANISVNGVSVGTAIDWAWDSNITSSLQHGVNVVCLRCQNMGGPAGVLLTIMGENGVVLARSDSSWGWQEEGGFSGSWPAPTCSLQTAPTPPRTYGSLLPLPASNLSPRRPSWSIRSSPPPTARSSGHLPSSTPAVHTVEVGQVTTAPVDSSRNTSINRGNISGITNSSPPLPQTSTSLRRQRGNPLAIIVGLAVCCVWWWWW